MVSASHMELQDPGTTCGPLLLSKKVVTARVHMCPLRLPHHMLGMTTSVKQAMMMTYLVLALGGILMTHSGMAKTVRGISVCECTFNSPPWFCKQLPQATTEDIEVRICTSQEMDIPLENLEIYIHWWPLHSWVWTMHWLVTMTTKLGLIACHNTY